VVHDVVVLADQRGLFVFRNPCPRGEASSPLQIQGFFAGIGKSEPAQPSHTGSGEWDFGHDLVFESGTEMDVEGPLNA